MARNVVLQLLVDISKFGTGLQSAAKMVDGAFNKMGASASRGGKAIMRATAQTKKATGAFSALSGSLVRNIFFFAGYYNALLLVNSVATSTINHMFNLDEGLKKVQSITQESDESIAHLNSQLLEMARKGELAGKSAAEVAQAMFDIVQSGFSSAEALKIAAIAAEAAAAGFTEADIAGRAIVAVLNAFNLPAEQARHVADILFKTVDLGVITFGDLAQNIGDFIGTAALANVSLEELGAVMSVLTRRGLGAAESATSLNRMMLTFIKPSEKARKAAAALGIELSAEALASKGLVGALMEIQEATGGSVGGLAQVFDEIRGLRGASILLTDDGKELVQMLEEFGGASAGAGALAEAFEIRAEALRFRLQLLGSQFLALTTMAMIPLVGVLEKVFGGLSDLIAGKGDLSKWFKEVFLGATGLGDALKDLWATIRGGNAAGRGFIDLLKNLGEKAINAVPLIASLITQIVRLIDFLLENKVTLTALIVALTGMFIAAHPVLFLIMALAVAIGTLRDENATLTEKLIAAGVILAALPLLYAALSTQIIILRGYLFALFNVMGKSGAAVSGMSAAWRNLQNNTGMLRDDMIKLRNSIHGAITKLDELRRKMGLTMPEVKAKVGVGAERVGAAATTAGRAAGGMVSGVTTGIGFALGQGMKGLPAMLLKQWPRLLAALAPVMVALAGGVVSLLGSALAIALTLLPFIIIIGAALAAAFLIYKYRKQIWKGLKTIFNVLKEFFTEQLPAWFKANFTAEKIGSYFGWIAVALIVAMFPIPILIIKFRRQIMGFLRGIAGFVAGIPGMIADFIRMEIRGWKIILSAIFDVAKAVVGFRDDITSFLAGIASFIGEIPGKIADFLTLETGGEPVWKWILFVLFPVPALIGEYKTRIKNFLTGVASSVAKIPGKIAAFIGDHWKDVLEWLVNVPQWIAHFIVLLGRFVNQAAQTMIELPGRIASWIGDHWKDILGALIDVPKWIAEFGVKVAEFVAEVIRNIPGWFAGMGSAIGNAIKIAFTGAIDFLGWLKDEFLDWIPGWARGFMKGFGGPLKKFIEWLEGGGGPEQQTFMGMTLPQGQAGLRNFMGGLVRVGERGEELVRLPRGSDVIRNADIGQATRAAARGGGPSIHAEANINATMGDWSTLKKMVLRAVEERLDTGAARAGLTKPRFGTFGAGIPRT